jgi:hypothetical protein
MRALTILPVLLLGLMTAVWGFFTALFGMGMANAVGQRCVGECIAPDRASQFAVIFAILAGLTLVVTFVHAIVTFGIWRRRSWAVVAGIVLSALGFIALVALGPESFGLLRWVAALIYGVALLAIVIGALRDGRREAAPQ